MQHVNHLYNAEFVDCKSVLIFTLLVQIPSLKTGGGCSTHSQGMEEHKVSPIDIFPT